MHNEFKKMKDGTIIVSDIEGHTYSRNIDDDQLLFDILLSENCLELISNKIDDMNDSIDASIKTKNFYKRLEKCLVYAVIGIPILTAMVCSQFSTLTLLIATFSSIAISSLGAGIGATILSNKENEADRHINGLNRAVNKAKDLKRQYINTLNGLLRKSTCELKSDIEEEKPISMVSYTNISNAAIDVIIKDAYHESSDKPKQLIKTKYKKQK